MQDHNNTNEKFRQEGKVSYDRQVVLEDLNSKGKEREHSKYKTYSLVMTRLLEQIRDRYYKIGFDRLFENKEPHATFLYGDDYRNYKYWATIVKKCQECGNYLKYGLTLSGRKKLIGASFCQYRLCPYCQWRRSLKRAIQMFKVAEEINTQGEFEWIHLRLSISNCDGDSLRSEIGLLSKAFARFKNRKAINAVVQGYIRNIEVTINRREQPEKPYNHHIHALLLVKKDYFLSESYMDSKEWRWEWAESLKKEGYQVEYYEDGNPKLNIWVEKVKPRNQKSQESSNDGQVSRLKAVLETTKYSMKPADYLPSGLGWFDGVSQEDIDYNADNLLILHNALKNKNLVSIGGMVRSVWREMYGTLPKDEGEEEEVDVEHDLEQDSEQVMEDLINLGESEKDSVIIGEITYSFYRSKLNYYSGSTVTLYDEEGQAFERPAKEVQDFIDSNILEQYYYQILKLRKKKKKKLNNFAG